MSYRFKNNRAGFTLIEMIVVIAIFGIVTTVVLANLPVFRDRSSLDLVAQEVAINIRGAQVYGASGRVQDTIGRPTYRINFVNTPQNTFTLSRLDSVSGNFKKLETYTLSTGFQISSYCLLLSASGKCTSSTDSTNMSLEFTRPNLEPKFYNGSTEDTNIVEVDVTISSLRTGESRLVKVFKNGQISVIKQ